MAQANTLRWTPFAKKLPPTGVKVQIKSGLSAASAKTRTLTVVSQDGSLVKMQELVYAKKQDQWTATYFSEYQKGASWRYASGKTPSKESVARAALKAAKLAKAYEDYCKDEQRRAREKYFAQVRAERAEQLKLDKLTLDKAPKVDTHGMALHFKRDAPTWTRGDCRSTAACGAIAGGYLTRDVRLVTCGRCKKGLQSQTNLSISFRL